MLPPLVYPFGGHNHETKNKFLQPEGWLDKIQPFTDEIGQKVVKVRTEKVAVWIFSFYPSCTKGFVDGFINWRVTYKWSAKFIQPNGLILSVEYVIFIRNDVFHPNWWKHFNRQSFVDINSTGLSDFYEFYFAELR